jgi:hypothetical protein
MVQRLKQLSRRHEHPRGAAHPPATHGVDPKIGRARGAQERRSAGSTGACFSLNSLALFALYLSALWAWHQSGLSDCKLNGLYLTVAPVVRTHPYFAVSVCGSSPETIVAVSGKVIAIPVF